MPPFEITFPVENYDLALTLASGQCFRWSQSGDAWTGVIGSRWILLRQERDCIRAQTTAPPGDWQWLRHYLQTDVDLGSILVAFPDDPPMREAVAACRGLRLLRQPPWECLASFICSSAKQIMHIKGIVGALCRTFGQPVQVPPGMEPAWAFPTVERLAAASDAQLRKCMLGFRARYLSGTARKLAAGELDLSLLRGMSLEQARAQLLTLPGVGVKIADCVLLFAYGFHEAFPVDVWMSRALRKFYFADRRVGLAQLRRFACSHFGPHAGYAQQYLFHYMRTAARRPAQTRIVIRG